MTAGESKISNLRISNLKSPVANPPGVPHLASHFPLPHPEHESLHALCGDLRRVFLGGFPVLEADDDDAVHDLAADAGADETRAIGAKSFNAPRGSTVFWKVVEKRTFPPFWRYVKSESCATARLGY